MKKYFNYFLLAILLILTIATIVLISRGSRPTQISHYFTYTILVINGGWISWHLKELLLTEVPTKM
jgi:hypothetical protein